MILKTCRFSRQVRGSNGWGGYFGHFLRPNHRRPQFPYIPVGIDLKNWLLFNH